MPQTTATADELIWLFHERLAGTPLRNVGIAIVPIGGGNWSALTNATQRRHHPDLATTVARIEKQLRARFRLKD